MSGDKDALIYLADVRIDELEAENEKLREELVFERCENGWAREFLNRMGPKCATKDCSSLVAYVTKLESDNAKLRELVRDLWLTGSLCDAIPDMRLQAKGGDWRTMKDRVDEVLGIEVDA